MPDTDAGSSPTPTPDGDPGAIPAAVIRRERRISAAWIIPLLAIVFAGWLGWRAWQQRGVIITVQLPEGHGLQPGDDVRYRGITIGEVRDVSLDARLDGVLVTAGLRPEASRLARAGSRFWVVRPRLKLTSIEGLETLIGPRYLAVLPGGAGAPPWRHFIGLAEPPVVEQTQPGDLEVIVEAADKGSLAPGSPVTYRRIRIGTVLSVGLASDGGSVEARVHIQKAFASLIRERTRFWDAGGIRADVGLTGFSLEVESIETALRGSIAIATPPEAQAGAMVRTGHRFTLFHEPKDEWLEWKPVIAIGSSLLPPGAPMPTPLRARIGWTQGRFFKNERTRHGWVLQTDRGLLGPADLLRPGEKADRATVVLEVAGDVVPLADEPVWTDGALSLVDAHVARNEWLGALITRPDQPVDCIAIADPASDPIPLAASRLSVAGDGTWRIDRGLSIDDSWHGAVVVSRESGHVVGVLLIDDDDEPKIALVPAAFE